MTTIGFPIKRVKIITSIKLQKASDDSCFKPALKYALGHSIKMLEEANALFNAHPQEEMLIAVAAFKMKPFDLVSPPCIHFHLQFLIYVPLRLNKYGKISPHMLPRSANVFLLTYVWPAIKVNLGVTVRPPKFSRAMTNKSSGALDTFAIISAWIWITGGFPLPTWGACKIDNANNCYLECVNCI